jgi:hypothetical protein
LYCATIGVYLGGEKDLLDDSLAHTHWKRDRKQLMLEAFDGCMQCETFCNQLGAVNDLRLWASTNIVMFSTCQYIHWRGLAVRKSTS